MFKRKGLAALVAVITLTAAPIAQAQSLSEALASAYNNSGLLEQNRALLRAADENVAQSVAATLPIINWSLSASRTRTTSPVTVTTDAANARIAGSLTLYDFGASDLAVEAQKEIVLSTRQSLRGVEQDVLLRAVQAYTNVLSAKEFVQLRENNVRLITQEFRAAQDRFEVGEVTRTDVSLAEARLASARSLLASAQGDLAIASAEFNAAIGQMPTSPRTVGPAPVSGTLGEAQAFAVRNHPAILESQHSVAAAELSVRRAEASSRPSVSLDGFVGVDQDGNESGQIGINIGGPIYTGGLLASQVRQFGANRDAARSRLLVVTQAVQQQVANAWAQLQVARAVREASDQQISAAQVAFDGVREEAQLDARTTLDVLNAEQELLDARVGLIAAQANEVVASYSLLAAMGLLTADHLNLAVQQYDPSEYYNLVKTPPLPMSEQGRALDRVLEAIGQD
jgi:outer membrane protein